MKSIFAAALAATLLSGIAAARAAEPTQADVNHFVYDSNGEIVGGLKSIGPNGAVVSVGLWSNPGYRLVTIPAARLTVAGGQVMLNGMSAAELGQQTPAHLAAR